MLAPLFGTARRIVLGGHPRAGGRIEPTVLRPKELLLALTSVAAEAAGHAVVCANPHFQPVAGRSGDVAVAHFSQLDLACPVPGARNVLVLDGEDMLALAEEARSEGGFGLRLRRARLMDLLLSVAPPAMAPNGLAGRVVASVPIPELLEHLPTLAAAEALQPAGPVQWMGCDLETGHYNYLELKRRPRLGTSHLRVLMDPGGADGTGPAVAFATPGNLVDIAPVLRAFAAVRGDGATPEGGFVLLFFGSPEEFAAAVAAHPDAMFFGDNFRCPAMRILFAPFAAAEVLAAIAGARLVVDCCHGGVLAALAGGLGVARRITLGPCGSLDAEMEDGVAVRDIAWDGVLDMTTLARRRHKADRSGERRLAELLDAMLGPLPPGRRAAPGGIRPG